MEQVDLVARKRIKTDFLTTPAVQSTVSVTLNGEWEMIKPP